MRKIPISPLVIFKIGLALIVLLQSIGNLADAKMMFADDGLFPLVLANLYYPQIYYHFGLIGGLFICSLMALLAILSFRKQWQNFCFFIISILQILLAYRNALFINSGDYALIFLSAMAALTPPATWQNRKSWIRQLDLLPLILLAFFIYAANFVFKLQSSWSSGTGLSDTLQHLEMTRFNFLPIPNLLSISLSYASILIVMGACFTPFISHRKRVLKNSLIVVVLLYHAAANIFLKLSWLSLPFVLLQLVFWVPQSSNLKFESKESLALNLGWRQKVALSLLLFAFFGMRSTDDSSAFSKAGFPIGHNWYMFAPPPTTTGAWDMILRSSQSQTQKAIANFKNQFPFAVFQHEYKFLYNLRRAEFVPVVVSFSQFLCNKISRNEAGEFVESIQLHYQGRNIRTQEELQFGYPISSCHHGLQATELLTQQPIDFAFSEVKKGTVLFFLSAKCPCVNLVIDKIKELNLKYSHDQFRFFAINVDPSMAEPELKDYFQSANLGFPSLRDSGLKISKSFQVKTTSEVVVINGEGKTLYQGGIRTEKNEELLEKTLNEIEQNKKVTNPQGELFGCTLEYPREA